MNEVYTFHLDGVLFRGTTGRSHWKRKKTYVFVDKEAAERQAESMEEDVKVVRYVPAEDECDTE